MKKKAAIELSTNFIIGLIMGIIMFSFGLIFLGKLMNVDPGPLPSTYDMYEKQCIQNGDKVCVPELYKVIKKGQLDKFGVIINNIVKSNAKFRPYVEFSRGETEDGADITSVNLLDWTAPQLAVQELKNNEHIIVPLAFKVPTGVESGSYVFNVRVCYDKTSNPPPTCSSGPALYSPTKQITIEVP